MWECHKTKYPASSKHKLQAGKIRREKQIKLQTYETYQPNAMGGTSWIPVLKIELYKHFCDNIHGIFGGNLNTNWVFEDNGFIDSNFRLKNNSVYAKKRSILTFYRWFLSVCR